MTKEANIARPYAKAAFEYASENNVLTAWSALLATAALVVADSDMTDLLKNPRITSKQAVEIVVDICKDMLDDASERFIRLLADAGRLSALPSVVELFDAYKADAEKVVDVQVTSARPLKKNQQIAITTALEKRFQRDVVMHYNEDSRMIGGFVVRAKDFVIDGSVRSQLMHMMQDLCA